MTHNVSSAIVDNLTDVKMPHYSPLAQASGSIDVDGYVLPEYHCNTLVLGSGAAGWRAAVELKRRDVDVIVASSKAFWGTSACSGSDKQTLHTANTRGNGDRFLALSDALSAGGSMDEDTAYIEAVGSVNTCEVLKYLGLDLPEDTFGATLRYQTDHDEFGRATSCGPRTSRLMVKVLAQEAMRLNIPLLNHTTAIKILTDGEGEMRHVTGVVAIDKSCRENPWRMVIIRCQHLVFATGGPGELYRESVYPVSCFSGLGMALEAGITLVNLTESQFGIGTPRTRFPWNLSGTYMQAMPRIFSQDSKGQRYNFLADYYPTTRMLASAIFRKGYQWPFHAERMLDYGSSLLDVAVFEETQKGNAVFLDFLSEPEPAADGIPFSLNNLDEDVVTYLKNNDALLAMPFARLQRMNPLAIRLYQLHGQDISKSPLQFTLNNQHLNGGIDVDVWGKTSLAGCYAAGENAGTHGVTRPGGAALNAGQVFARRCAQHIAHQPQQAQHAGVDRQQILSVIHEAQKCLTSAPQGLLRENVREIIQTTMSTHAAILCRMEGIEDAVRTIKKLCDDIEQFGIQSDANSLTRSLQWQQSTRLALAVLLSLQFYIHNGGGSRGARAIYDGKSGISPQSARGPLQTWSFRPETQADRQRMICIRRVSDDYQIYSRICRERGSLSLNDFERQWLNWLTASVFYTTE